MSRVLTPKPGPESKAWSPNRWLNPQACLCSRPRNLPAFCGLHVLQTALHSRSAHRPPSNLRRPRKGWVGEQRKKRMMRVSLPSDSIWTRIAPLAAALVCRWLEALMPRVALLMARVCNTGGIKAVPDPCSIHAAASPLRSVMALPDTTHAHSHAIKAFAWLQPSVHQTGLRPSSRATGHRPKCWMPCSAMSQGSKP